MISDRFRESTLFFKYKYFKEVCLILCALIGAVGGVFGIVVYLQDRVESNHASHFLLNGFYYEELDNIKIIKYILNGSGEPSRVGFSTIEDWELPSLYLKKTLISGDFARDNDIKGLLPRAKKRVYLVGDYNLWKGYQFFDVAARELRPIKE